MAVTEPRAGSNATRSTRRGFTLIELLVVIAVIALLVGLILPSLGSVRKRGRTLACSSNLRSIGQVLAIYADDFKQWHPPTSDWQVWEGDGSFPDEPGLGWTEHLRGYVSTPAIYVDKARPDAPYAYFLQARYPLLLQNATGSPPSPGRPLALQLSGITFGSLFVLGGDCVNKRFFSQPYGASPRTPNCDLDDGELECVFVEDGFDPHGGIVNLLFADNHVAGFKEYRPDAMTWHGREMRDWASTR